MKPTVGRQVHFFDSHTYSVGAGRGVIDHPKAATIVYVHSETVVNLCVFDHNGVPHSVGCVPFLQAHEPSTTGFHCAPPVIVK